MSASGRWHEPVHRQAAVGFDRAGDDYERGRPGYPPAAVQLLATQLDLGAGKRVLDLAAGTGKLTRAMTGFGAEVVAVEPVAGMREKLVASLPEVTTLEGTAERIPSGDGTFDGVVVAQAFHWFDAAAAAAEIHRVLVPDGALAVIWNSWDESVAWVARTQEIVHRHVRGAPQQRTSSWEQQLRATGLFGDPERSTFPNIVIGDIDTLLARVSSVSYISALGDDERERVREAVRAVIDEDPSTSGRAEFEMPYTTTLVCFSRR